LLDDTEDHMQPKCSEIAEPFHKGKQYHWITEIVFDDRTRNQKDEPLQIIFQKRRASNDTI